MAKYNILDEDDIFSESGNEKKDSDKLKEQEDGPEINIDGEDLFDDSLLVEDKKEKADVTDDFFDSKPEEDLDLDIEETTAPDTSDEKLKDFFMDENDKQENDRFEEEDLSEEPQKEKTEVRQIIEDYEDDKIDGLNYKPFVIGAVVIFFLVAAYFIIDMWILGDSAKDEVAEEIVDTTPVQPQLTPEQIRKKQQLAHVAGRTNREMTFIGSIIEMADQNVKLSSVLLYDKAFLFEVFSGDRGNLAKMQRQIKISMPDEKIDIISSVTRPGEAGGIFGIYGVEIDGQPGTKEVQTSFTNAQEAKNWLSDVSASSGLTLAEMKESATRNENGFRVLEMETLMSGSLNNCKSIISKIAGSAANLKVHKLNMTANDQKTFGKSSFRLKMILQIYV